MRIIGLDIGNKRIGIAVSDALELTAQPVKTITRSSDSQALEELDQLLASYQATKIVVGLPVQLDGTETDQTRLTQRFIDKLSHRFRNRATVIAWDERFSTAGAERTLLAADLSRAKRRRVIDKMAAVFMLQGYLDGRKQ